MSMTDDQQTDEQRDQAGLTPAERRILQQKADRAEQLEAELKGVQFQLGIRDAGLELNDRQRQLLMNAHEGERTPEAIRQTAVDLGWAEKAPVAPDVPADELAAHQRMTDASSGASTRHTTPEAEIDARLAAARTEAEFDAIYRESGRPVNH